MKLLTQKHIRHLALFIISIWIAAVGCVKEYSFEGEMITDFPSPADSTVTLDSANNFYINFSSCNTCAANSLPFTRWSFKNGNTLLCGNISGAVINEERNAITFFGPSLCNKDSGLIVAAFFYPSKLDRDVSHVEAQSASFQYYDNITPSFVIKSWPPHSFSLIIDKYVQATRRAIGHFSGYTFTENGDSTFIHSGTFNIILDK